MRSDQVWKKSALVSLMALVGAISAGCIDDPGTSDQQPLYRWERDNTPSSAERGNVLINEIGWAGSVSDEGVYDKEDVFIELMNKHPRPINLSGWQLEFGGDYEYSLRLPQMDKLVYPNEFFVIAAKKDGAFGESADLILEDLKLGSRAVYITLTDNDRRLMESAGSRQDFPFAGGYDLVTVRSMERSQVLFGNRGNEDRSWHSNIDDASASGSAVRRGIAQGWRKFTLASPGEPNSADYAGATTSGTFE